MRGGGGSKAFAASELRQEGASAEEVRRAIGSRKPKLDVLVLKVVSKPVAPRFMEDDPVHGPGGPWERCSYISGGDDV